MQIKLLDSRIPLPTLQHPGDAGFDLQAAISEPLKLYPNTTCKVRTGIAVHIEDPGLVGLVFPRSGTGSRGLVLGNLTGVIDSSYQGEIQVSLWNRSEDPIVIQPLERIAQLVFLPIHVPTFQAVDEFTAASSRGEGGFGSTNQLGHP